MVLIRQLHILLQRQQLQYHVLITYQVSPFHLIQIFSKITLRVAVLPKYWASLEGNISLIALNDSFICNLERNKRLVQQGNVDEPWIPTRYQLNKCYLCRLS